MGRWGDGVSRERSRKPEAKAKEKMNGKPLWNSRMEGELMKNPRICFGLSSVLFPDFPIPFPEFQRGFYFSFSSAPLR
jgi:hypothetical protein